MASVPQGTPPLVHTVQSGDTLFLLAQAYYNDGNLFSKIASANNNIAPESLQVGQKLVIPAR